MAIATPPDAPQVEDLLHRMARQHGHANNRVCQKCVEQVGFKIITPEQAVAEAAEKAAKTAQETAETAEQAHKAYETAAQLVLNTTDPLTLIEPNLRRLGYGGDIRPALLVYLSATTRLLSMDEMLGHLLIKAPASTGKSYAINTVLKLFPDDTVVRIESGSARVAIYDERPLEHKVLVFAEADSIPSGEEFSAVASAIRNILTDNELVYRVVVTNPGKKPNTVTIHRPGPTVMLTTSIRSLDDQMMSRLYVLDLPSDHDQLRASLTAQAEREVNGSKNPGPALVAYQGYLQGLAPFHVVVPFAHWLSDGIADSTKDNRANRDFSRLLSLIKAVTILRHQHRERDGDDRLIATIEDYAFVYDILAHVYEASATGITSLTRDIHRVVGELKAGNIPKVNAAAIAKHLPKQNEKTVSREVNRMLKSELLIDESATRVKDLRLGNDLPDRSALPQPDTFMEAVA